MTKNITAMEARKSFGSLLDRAYYQNKSTVIKRAGKPMGAIVPVEVLEGIQKYSVELNQKIKAAAKKNRLGYQTALDLANAAKKFSRR